MTKFVYIGTVAETGDRMPPIHWGRVGDPIKPSMFDYYAVSKVKLYIKSMVSSKLTAEKEELIYSFIMYGSLNIIIDWINSDFRLPAKEVSELLYHACDRVVKSFL